MLDSLVTVLGHTFPSMLIGNEFFYINNGGQSFKGGSKSPRDTSMKQLSIRRLICTYKLKWDCGSC